MIRNIERWQTEVWTRCFPAKSTTKLKTRWKIHDPIMGKEWGRAEPLPCSSVWGLVVRPKGRSCCKTYLLTEHYKILSQNEIMEPFHHPLLYTMTMIIDLFADLSFWCWQIPPNANPVFTASCVQRISTFLAPLQSAIWYSPDLSRR